MAEAALELGILRAPGLAPLLRGLQRWALRSAQALSTISPHMLERLEENVGENRQISFIPNWIHKGLQTEIDRQMPQAPSRTPGLLFYSGNLGVKQGLPAFIDQFHSASGAELGWSLKINGGGAERNRVQSVVGTKLGIRIGPVEAEEAYVRSLLEAAARNGQASARTLFLVNCCRPWPRVPPCLRFVTSKVRWAKRFWMVVLERS